LQVLEVLGLMAQVDCLVARCCSLLGQGRYQIGLEEWMVGQTQRQRVQMPLVIQLPPDR
jgi:hypothetical protein